MKYEINIILKCNWKCEYCAIKEELNKEINNIFNILLGIPKNSYLILSGGEPGLLDFDFFLKIFNLKKIKNLKLELNTNGLFISKFPNFLNEFERINLHIDFFNKKSYKPDSRFNNVVIVTEQNFENLEFYLKKYNIKFDLIPSTHYDFKENEFTLKKDLLKYKKYMTKESIDLYLYNNRYKNITYLN